MPVAPERKAELDERSEYEEALAGILEGYEDLKAGRTRDAYEVFAELRLKHGLSGG